MTLENATLTILSLGLVLLPSCSAEIGTYTGEGTGSVSFVCGTSGEIRYEAPQTRADGNTTRTLPETVIPESDALRLEISNEAGLVAEYGTMAGYDQPLLTAGDYTARFTGGDPSAEGPEAAYFEAEHSFTVVARKASTETVSISLANSVVSVLVSQWFADYYPVYNISIRTESGYTVSYSNSGTEPGTETSPVFVKAGTALYFSGTATKTNGTEVSFPETRIAGTKARTWQTVSVNASQAAGGSIEIVLDDTPVDIKEVAIELNPDA